MRRALALAVALALAGSSALAWPAHLAVSGGGGPPAPTTIYKDGNLSMSSGAATVAASGGCAAGQTAIAMLGNFVSSGAVSITDARGNTWSFVRDGFPAGNVYGSIWKSTISSSLIAGDNLTLTMGSGVTHGYVILDCIGSLTADATGGGNTGGATPGSPVDINTSGSPPTNAARVFMFFANFGDRTTMTVSDPLHSGWIAGDTAIDPSPDYGFGLYYQDVSAGASSTLRWTHTGVTSSWGTWWISFD